MSFYNSDLIKNNIHFTPPDIITAKYQYVTINSNTPKHPNIFLDIRVISLLICDIILMQIKMKKTLTLIVLLQLGIITGATENFTREEVNVILIKACEEETLTGRLPYRLSHKLNGIFGTRVINEGDNIPSV